MSGYEKETIVNFNEEEGKGTIYTHKKGLMNRLDKFCEKFPDDYKLIKEDEFSKTYEFTKNLITFRSPKEKKILTEEEKQKLRERFAKGKNKG